MRKTRNNQIWYLHLLEQLKFSFPRPKLSDKLLLTFATAALLTVLIATISWLSFQEVVQSQSAIVTEAIPLSTTVQAIALSNSKIISIAPQLSRVTTHREYDLLRDLLREQVTSMKYLLGDLSERRFEPKLSLKLTETVRAIDDNTKLLTTQIGTRLDIQLREKDLFDNQRKATRDLVTISESLVANASASITSYISSLYSVLGRDDSQSATTFDALDQLIEVEIDQMERMTELQLTCFQQNALIEQLEDASNAELVARLLSKFKANLEVLKRRIEDIDDPSRRQNATNLNLVLNDAVTTGGVFNTRLSYLALAEKISLLQQSGNQESMRLNEHANVLLRSATDAIDDAGLAAKLAVDRGFAGFLLVAVLMILLLIVTLWALTRHHLVSRLRGMEQAVDAISTDDFDVDIAVSGDDELARLGKALDRLRDNARERKRLEGELRRQQHTLEQQVEQRTGELRKSNELLENEVAEHAQARTEAERADQAKTTFLATMSHELRTPLSGVLGTLQLLGDTLPSEQQMDYIRMIRAANTTLLEILEDMLGYSKLESGKLNLDYRALSVLEVIDNILSLQALRAQTKNIALIREIRGDVPELIYSDRAKLNQILLNLVGNAIKFTDEGSVTLSVKSAKEQSGPEHVRLTFTVTDTGIGIPESKRSEVFNPFYQIADIEHRRHGGTGLGLAICKKLVEAMGGQIWINPNFTKGAAISFFMVCAIARRAPISKPEISPPPSARLTQSLVVLVVEDDDINRQVCTHYLKSLGHQPLVVRDGIEALTLLQHRAEPIDAILMDIGLPGSSGVEVALKIRVLPGGRWEQVPIVAMSAHVFGETVEEYYASGMVGFLSKPFDKEQMEQMLLSVISGNPENSITELAENESTYSDTTKDPLLDIDYVNAELESLGSTLFSELLGLFTNEAEKILANIRAHKAAGEWPELSQLAHRLCGSAGNLGMVRLAKQARLLEKKALEPPDGSSRVEVILSSIQKMLKLSCAELEQKLRSGLDH